MADLRILFLSEVTVSGFWHLFCYSSDWLRLCCCYEICSSSLSTWSSCICLGESTRFLPGSTRFLPELYSTRFLPGSTRNLPAKSSTRFLPGSTRNLPGCKEMFYLLILKPFCRSTFLNRQSAGYSTEYIAWLVLQFLQFWWLLRRSSLIFLPHRLQLMRLL